jgi:hypothetical protein
MPVTPDLMYGSLLFSLVGMAALAFFYLRRRRVPLWSLFVWSLLIFLVPFLGPFLVILARPGKWKMSETAP